MTTLKNLFLLKILQTLVIVPGLVLLVSCSPVTLPESNQYQISSYSAKSLVPGESSNTLLVTNPEAVAGYQTEAMLYIKTPYQLEAFAKNAWVNAPANMLYPLLIQSLQHSGYFAAVSSSPYSQGADYRLDTQVLRLDQNFLKKPSVLEFAVKMVLTRVSDNHIIGSRIISEALPCPMDTPYGGVIAANKASLRITDAVSRFVVSSIKHHSIK